MRFRFLKTKDTDKTTRQTLANPDIKNHVSAYDNFFIHELLKVVLPSPQRTLLISAFPSLPLP